MKVKVRHIDETVAESREFTIVNNETELLGLISFIRQTGGIYNPRKGDIEPFNSYQFVMDEKEVFAEIFIGKES